MSDPVLLRQVMVRDIPLMEAHFRIDDFLRQGNIDDQKDIGESAGVCLFHQ